LNAYTCSRQRVLLTRGHTFVGIIISADGMFLRDSIGIHWRKWTAGSYYISLQRSITQRGCCSL
jgi:hypothetical protein